MKLDTFKNKQGSDDVPNVDDEGSRTLAKKCVTKVESNRSTWTSPHPRVWLSCFFNTLLSGKPSLLSSVNLLKVRAGGVRLRFPPKTKLSSLRKRKQIAAESGSILA